MSFDHVLSERSDAICSCNREGRRSCLALTRADVARTLLGANYMKALAIKVCFQDVVEGARHTWP